DGFDVSRPDVPCVQGLAGERAGGVRRAQAGDELQGRIVFHGGTPPGSGTRVPCPVGTRRIDRPKPQVRIHALRHQKAPLAMEARRNDEQEPMAPATAREASSPATSRSYPTGGGELIPQPPAYENARDRSPGALAEFSGA